MKPRLALSFVSSLLASASLTACTEDPVGSDPSDPARLALTECVARGIALEALWSIDNGHGAVHAITAGPSGTIALAGADGSIKLWTVGATAEDWSHQDLGAAYGGEFGEGAVVATLAFRDGRIAAGTTDGQLRLHDAESGSVMAMVSPNGYPLTAVTHAPDGRIAMADDGFQGDLALWDATANALTPLVRTEDSYTLWGATSLAFTDSGTMLAAGDWYGLAAVERWDDGAMTSIWVSTQEQLPLASGSEVLAIAPLPGGRAVAGGGAFGGAEGDARGFLALLDLEALDGAPRAVRVIDDHRVVALAPLADGIHLLSLGADGSLRVFDGATLEEVGRVDALGSSELVLTADGRAAATSGADGMLRVWGCNE
jgi:WD40 repeat protein